jgi:hypothetical protein
MTRRAAACLGTILLLAGCAKTSTSPTITMARTSVTTQPTRLILALDSGPGPATPAPLAEAVEQALAKGLGGPGIQISRLPPGAPPPAYGPATLLIRYRITVVKPGSQALRLTVGFGAGRAEMAMTTQIIDLRGAAPVALARFETKSTTGRMPGPVLGLATASASGQVLGLVGGTAGLLQGTRQTLTAEATQIGDQVAAHLEDYFRDQSWTVLAPPDRSVFSVAPLPPPRPL